MDKSNVIPHPASDPNPFQNQEDISKKEPKISPEDQKLLDTFTEKMMLLNSDQIPYQQKLDIVVDLNTIITPLMFKQLVSPMPSVDFSVIASRTNIALKDISAVIIKKRDAEVADEINLESPKFQLVFTWFMEVFSDVLSRNDIEETAKNNIFTDLSTALLGFEEICQKRLKGASKSAMASATNPLLEKFKNEET